LSSRNGETQMLAGLIKQDENTIDSGVPYLSKIPGLGRLFGSQTENKNRSEVILLITPTIDRNIDLPGSHISTIAMGTDDLTGDHLQLRGTSEESPAPTFTTPEMAPPANFPTLNTALPAPVLNDHLAADGPV
jgi:general secretion pathway protein D